MTTSVFKCMLVKENDYPFADQVLHPQIAGNFLKHYFQGMDREMIVVLMLNTKKIIIGISTITIGILDTTTIHPREVFKAAILASANSIILAHNHPSGDPDPSPEDHKTTEMIQKAGEVLRIPCLDHIIIGEETFYSTTSEQIYEYEEA